MGSAAEEVLYQNDHARVSRCRLPGGERVIVKQAIGAQAIRRLGHEVAMLARVAHIDGVAKVAGVPAEPNTLVLQDNGSESLAEFLRTRQLDTVQTVGFAGAVARILAGVHKAGVIHKDICPANVLIHPTTHEATLIDFNIASGINEQQAVQDAQAGIAGTLSYMSPEQTGRTGRAPDQRSDLYSLGVTLYELLTHRKPFESNDLLELVRDHLVRVPEAPRQVNAEVPQIVSDLVMRLLEKEADRRYQSAEGVVQDLNRIRDALQRGDATAFALGQFDFGSRLNPPSRPIGREAEIESLREAVGHAVDGRNPVLLMSGAPGVGKSALLGELRLLVNAQQGWFLNENFEQFRQSRRSAALQMLGRQLLAEPEDRLAQHREHILAALGSNLGIGPSLLPEFTLLLGPHDAIEVTDPREAEARTVQATLAVLRSVASPEQPVVLAFDDMQWASALTLQLLDAVVTSAQPLPGLLVVCAFRANEVAAGHPLSDLIERWKKLNLAAPHLALDNLTASHACELLGTMLRLPQEQAAALAGVLAERTQNNPYNTIEVLNALRADGLLSQNNGEWAWDAAAIRRHVGNSSVADLLGRRLSKLPEDAVETLQVIACLGGAVAQDVLALACALDPTAVQERLNPALDDGLVHLEPGSTLTLRFSHGRVQQAVFEAMPAEARAALHLTLARRLAAHPELNALAAEQYLPAAAALADETERRHAADLFGQAAQALRLPNAAAAERYLAAAIGQLSAVEKPADADRLLALQISHHLALFGLGRYDDLDATYAALVARTPDPVKLAEPARMQMYSLVNRVRFADAMTLGMNLLADLGMPKPADIRPAIGAGFQRLAKWNAGQDKAAEFDRPEIDDPRVLAWASIVAGAATGAYFADPPTFAWLVLEAHRLWVEHGPTSRILSTAGAVPFLQVGMPQDYRGAYLSSRHMTAVGEARGYEPGTSITRCIFGLAAGHWVDPVESVVVQFRRARHDLMSAGDASFCSYSFLASDMLLDCEPSLEAAAAEIEAGLTYYARTANEDSAVRFRARRQLMRSLRGETTSPGGLGDEGFDEAAYAKAMDPTSTTAATYHMLRSISAAIFGDTPTLIAHTAQALPLLPRTPGYYLTASARVLQGLALAEKARGLPAEERAAVIEELDGTSLKWLAARAADAPVNFLHLQRWIEAERAWAADTVWAAGAAFDAAVKEAALHARPWHRAIISERAAAFHLSQGMEHSARPLLAQACETYEAWGAAGKVKEMRRQHAFLRASSSLNRSDANARSTVVDTEMVDMMAVLRASQALSSQTSLLSLTAQVGKVLGAITGATSVQLIVKAEDASWVMAASLTNGSTPVTVEQAGAAGEVPFSVFRYAERTGQVLVIDDAVRDDRFTSDPYVERFDQCSLMLVPILKQGQLNAMLVLENNQRRAAFSADRLDSVAMIAGQLSVSLDNALLYASLEKRVAERTAQLRQKTNDINAMLQNMPQGVLTVMNGGAIHPEYSAYLATILETSEIADRNVMALLFTNTSLGADTLSQVDAAIGSCIGEDEMNYEFNSHLLATEFDKAMADGRVKSLALSWSPICDDSGTVDKLMLCVRDVTELKRLETEANTRKRELQMIGEILAVSQEKFHEFVDGARAFIEENKRLIEQAAEKREDTINLLFRNMHTIKGNARTYGLLGLTNQVHVTEQSYDDLRKSDEAEWRREALLADLESVKSLVEKYSHVNDTVLGRKGPGRRAGVEKFLMVERETVQQSMQLLLAVDQNDPTALREALSRVGSTLNMIGTQPLKDILAGTLDSLPSLAQELGKEPPRVEIEDRGIVIRTQAGSLLKNLFTHLLRNSVDHGIERAVDRKTLGKPTAGRINLGLAVDDGKLWIRLQDDGRGLAIAKIRQRATEQNLITRGQKKSDAEIAQLIFRSGFSTAEQVTEVSGRGVGMDAVRGFLEKDGGSIEIRFLDDKEDADYRAFETVIALPDKYAASLSAAMSFDALCARMQALKASPNDAQASAL